jgi:hypothetical protein
LKAVVAEGRQEVEDCRHSVGYSVDDKRRTFLALGLEVFPWPVSGLIFMCKEVSGAFSRTLAASLSIAQSKFFGRSLVPRPSWFWFRHCLELRRVRPCQS